jgi:hypothetical protein
MGPNTKIKQEINQQGIINKGINTGGGNFLVEILSTTTLLSLTSQSSSK